MPEVAEVMSVKNDSFEIVEENGYKDYTGGVVRKYDIKSSITYPCVVLGVDEIKQYQVTALKALMTGTSSELYTIYIKSDGSLIEIGRMAKERLRILFDSKLISDDIHVMLASDTVLTGDMIYAVCPI